MRKFLISTERTCDLPMDILVNKNINYISMKFSINNVEYDQSVDMSSKEFCDYMRKGAITKTSSVNMFDAKNYFEELLKQGKDILHLAFTSGLSGSCDNIKNVAKELNETHENKIYVVDSLCACSGQGLLCILATEKADEGEDIQVVFNYIEALKYKICHFFTVDDLKYLERGGRISKTTATLGSLIQIKPVLKIDNEGRIVQDRKVISRKKSITTLCNIFTEKFSNTCNKIYISHADSLEDATLLKNLIKQKTGLDSEIYELGQVICSHSGPGTIALFFVGEER